MVDRVEYLCERRLQLLADKYGPRKLSAHDQLALEVVESQLDKLLPPVSEGERRHLAELEAATKRLSDSLEKRAKPKLT